MADPLRVATDRAAPEADRVAACERAALKVERSAPPERHGVWSKLFPLALDVAEPLAVREAAAWAGRHMRETAINNLVARAVPDAPSVRRAMVRALAEIAREPPPAYFEGRLREDLAKLDSELSLTPFVNLTLNYGAEPRALEALRRGLGDGDAAIRRSALFQLAAVGDLGAAVAVLRSDGPPPDRAAAAEALGYYWTGDDEVPAALAAALHDPDPDVARAAKVARRRLKLSSIPKPKSPRPAAEEDAGAGARDPWAAFLRQWSQELLQVDAFALEQEDEVVESGYLGLPAASEVELQDLERRLGRSLPPSYRSFLATSNGFLGGGLSIRRIRPAAEVRPFVEEEREWVDIWTRDDPGGEWEVLRSAIQVSDVGDAAVYLLCPDAAGPDGEWEAWLFASWIPGAHRHASWWDLLQAERRSFVELEHPSEPPA